MSHTRATTAVRIAVDRRSGPAGSWETFTLPVREPRTTGVLAIRGHDLKLGAPRRRVELPSLTIGIVFSLEGTMRVATSADAPADVAPQGLIAGPRPTAIRAEHGGRLRVLEVVLEPWAAHGVLGIPAGELPELGVDAAEVLGARVRRLEQNLPEARGWAECLGLLYRTFPALRDPAPPPDPRLAHVCHRLAAGPLTSGASARVAAEVGWSEAQLRRAFRQQIGVSPKTAARILRLQRAIRQLASAVGQVRTASDCGFYDQAHLCREVSAMTGHTPGMFAPQATRRPPGPPTMERAPGRSFALIVE